MSGKKWHNSKQCPRHLCKQQNNLSLKVWLTLLLHLITHCQFELFMMEYVKNNMLWRIKIKIEHIEQRVGSIWILACLLL